MFPRCVFIASALCLVCMFIGVALEWEEPRQVMGGVSPGATLGIALP